MADNPTLTALTNLTPEAIAQALMSLTPERKAAIQAAAAQAGIAIGGSANGVERMKDGGLRLTVTLAPEVGEPLLTWAESANEELSPFIQKIINDAVTGYVFQDWGGAAPAAPAASAAAGTPTA